MFLQRAPGRAGGPDVLLLLVALVGMSACGVVAGRVGKESTRSALEETQEQLVAIPPEHQGIVAERAFAGAVRGTLDELSTPERSEQLATLVELAMTRTLRGVVASQSAPVSEGTGGSGLTEATAIRQLSEQLAAGVADGILRRLEAELGAEGGGPLTETLVASSRRVTTASLQAVEEQLAFGPDCAGRPRRECLERAAFDIGKAASGGMMSGLTLPLLLFTFMAGACLAAILMLLGRAVARRRPDR